MISCCSCGVPLLDLRPSTVTDILVWCATNKPAIRSQLLDRSDSVPLREWAEAQGASFALDHDGFFCVARGGSANELLQLDRAVASHEYELGIMLGYPRCCAATIAEIGERQIDERVSLVSRWYFAPPYHLINPSGYARGEALISHVPCTPSCTASLRIAEAVRDHVAARPRCGHIEPLSRTGMLS
jgi:hypothetical protein